MEITANCAVYHRVSDWILTLASEVQAVVAAKDYDKS